MDQRRFLTFITLCMLVILLNGLWTAKQVADREAAKPKPAAGAQDQAGANQAKPQDAGAKPAEDAADNAAPLNAAANGGQPAAEAEPARPEEFITLGSVDPASDYRMLVTMTNRGAAVRRVAVMASFTLSNSAIMP